MLASSFGHAEMPGGGSSSSERSSDCRRCSIEFGNRTKTEQKLQSKLIADRFETVQSESEREGNGNGEHQRDGGAQLAHEHQAAAVRRRVSGQRIRRFGSESSPLSTAQQETRVAHRDRRSKRQKEKTVFFIFSPLLMHSQTGVGAFDRV
jgi:hypothetical protein